MRPAARKPTPTPTSAEMARNPPICLSARTPTAGRRRMLSMGPVTRGQSIRLPAFFRIRSQNGSVRFRSHLMRPLDMADPWNRSVLFLSAMAGAVGAYLTVFHDRDPLLALEAGGSTFLAWALCRELDPDRQTSAIAVAVFGGASA